MNRLASLLRVVPSYIVPPNDEICGYAFRDEISRAPSSLESATPFLGQQDTTQVAHANNQVFDQKQSSSSFKNAGSV
jgi:hypothetical protein